MVQKKTNVINTVRMKLWLWDKQQRFVSDVGSRKKRVAHISYQEQLSCNDNSGLRLSSHSAMILTF